MGEEESREAGRSREALVPAGRVLLAPQAPRNLLPHTVLEVVNRLPFPQVNCLQDVHLVEARDSRFMGTGLFSFANAFINFLFIYLFIYPFPGSMEVVTQESQEEAYLGVDFHSYSGHWPGEAWPPSGPRHICIAQRLVCR